MTSCGVASSVLAAASARSADASSAAGCTRRRGSSRRPSSRGSCRSARQHRDAVDEDATLAAHDPQRALGRHPHAGLDGLAPRPPCGPAAARACQRRLVDPEAQVEVARSATPSRMPDAVDEPDVARTTQRVGGVGRDLDLAQRHRELLGARGQHQPLRDDGPRRGAPASAPPPRRLPAHGDATDANVGRQLASYGRPSSAIAPASTVSAEHHDDDQAAPELARRRSSDPISAQGSHDASPQPHPIRTWPDARRQPTRSWAVPAARARARRAG